MHNPRIILAIVSCHMLTGSASVATRYMVSILDPLDIAFLRYLLGGLCLLPFVIPARNHTFNKNLIWHILSLGILFFAIFPWLHTTALQYTTASRGAIVLATIPIWAMSLGHFIGHERFSVHSLIGIIITIIGVGIAMYEKSITVLSNGGYRGELIMLIAAITGGVYSVVAKSALKDTSAFFFTPLAMLAGCLFLSPMALSNHALDNLGNLPDLPLLIMLYLGIIAGGLAFLLFNWALEKTTPTITTLFVTLNPITAIVLARLLLGETLTPYFFAGTILVIGGIVITLWPEE